MANPSEQDGKLRQRMADLYHSESGDDDRKGLCCQLARAEAEIDRLKALASSSETQKACSRCSGAGRDTYVDPVSPTGYTERDCPACASASPSDDGARQQQDENVIEIDADGVVTETGPLARLRCELQAERDNVQHLLDTCVPVDELTCECGTKLTCAKCAFHL